MQLVIKCYAVAKISQIYSRGISIWATVYRIAETWTVTADELSRQVAVLSQRGRAMLRVCQWLASIVQFLERSFFLIINYFGFLIYQCVQFDSFLLSSA